MTKTEKKWMALLGLIGLAVLSVGVGRRVPLFSGEAPAYRQKGPAKARVVITEYSDLQCPKCSQSVGTLQKLLDSYPKDVRLVFRHAPLKQHAWALLAAQAAESAGLQEKFWEYAERLFAQQTEWSAAADPKPFFQAYAKDLSLNLDRFNQDIDSPRVVDIVKKEKKHADGIEIPATPTFFINDRMVVGEAQLSANGARYIERELGR